MRTLRFLILILFCLTVRAQEAPKVVAPVAPAAPSAAAWALRAAGEVKVAVEIDRDGTVVSASVVGGHPLLRKSSEAAARKWRFAPPDAAGQRAVIIFDYIRGEQLSYPVDGTTGRIVDELTRQFIEPYKMEVRWNRILFVPTTELLPRVNGQVEEKFCELHQVRMKTDIVDIIYGLKRPPKGFEDRFEAEVKLFPNARTLLYGGRLVRETVRKEVHYCEKCREAQIEWTEQRLRKLGLLQTAENN